MSNSAENVYTNATSVKTDTPNTLVEALTQDKSGIVEPIRKEVGQTLSIKDGRDYAAINVRVVNSTYSAAEDYEKAVHLNQGKGSTGISVSINTLKRIIAWAESQ